MSRPPVKGGTDDLLVGSRVQVSAGPGIIRWTGVNPAFAAGKWVGVELFEPNGKNDGSVKGASYFNCRASYGMFVRPSQVTVLELPPSSRPPSRPMSAASSNAASSGLVAPPSARPATRTVSSRSVASQPPDNRSASPQKISRPPLPSSSGGATSPTALRTSTRRVPSQQGAGPTPSLASATASRLAGMKRSTSGNMLQVSGVAEPSSSSSVSPAGPSPEPSRPSPFSASVLRSPPASSALPALAPASEVPTSPVASLLSPTPSEAPLVIAPPPPSGPPPRDHGYEELKIRVRVLETKRAEELEKFRTLESRARELEESASGASLLQTKAQTLQTEVSHLRLVSKQLESANATLETRLTEMTDQLEMVTLDKEFAEEKGEAADLETEAEREKVAMLEVEVATLRDQASALDRPPEASGERSSLAFIQLERHNERLKDALIRLRDMTSEAEREQRARIADLEKDLAETSELSAQYELAQEMLDEAELQVEDLKIQLDDAMGAEDMLEALTEKNLAMGEKLEEQRITIEDLEALKELNDELEENHIETEKQLQEDLDFKDQLYREQMQRAQDLEVKVMDQLSTISQFRELVTVLQGEIEGLREQHSSQVSETQNITPQSQTVMNLNLKLQSSATKAKSKTIDLELRALEAQQALEHLAIVQTYLPQTYFEMDADSTNCLLFFERLAAKTALINSIIGQSHSLPDSLYLAASDTLVGTCEMRGQLSHFSLLNRRFAAFLRRCPVDAFLKSGGIYHELSGVEKRIDMYIDLLRKNEFKEADCVEDVVKFLAQYEHLSETYFTLPGLPDLDLGERELDLALGFDYDLDKFAAAVGFAMHVIVSASQDPDVVVDEGETSLEQSTYAPIRHVLDLVKSVKLASKKLVRRVEDLVRISSALQRDVEVSLKALVRDVSNAVDFAIQLAQRIGGYVGSIRHTKQPLELSAILGFLSDVTHEQTLKTGLEPWDVISMFVADLGRGAASVLPTLMEQEHVFKVTGSPPWLTRVETLRATAAINVEADRQLVKLTEEVRDLSRELRKRDQIGQEATVKIQLLERRMENAKGQAEAFARLETEVSQARKQDRASQDALVLLQTELDQAEKDVARLKASAPTPDAPAEGAGGGAAAGGDPYGGDGSLETHQLLQQIEGLRGALRFVRSENAFLKSQDLLSSLTSLPPLASLDPPPLSPSSSSSSVSDSEDPPLTPPPPFRTSTRHLLTETTLLSRELATFSASPLLIDLSDVKPGRWARRADKPERVMEERRREGDRLREKLAGLKDKVAKAKADDERKRWEP